MISRVMLLHVEHVPGLHRHSWGFYLLHPFSSSPPSHTIALRANKSLLMRYQRLTSDASEDVEAALEERTCLPIHSFALFFLAGQWIPDLFIILVGILQDRLGVVDGLNFQGGRGRAIVNRIVPSLLPHCLQFMHLWYFKVALSSVV